MIRKICERCGKDRTRSQNEDEIDSAEFTLRKTMKEFKAVPNNSRGQKDINWRIRLCPISSALCMECMFQILENKGHSGGWWIMEGDYPDEAYEPVQTEPEKHVKRMADRRRGIELNIEKPEGRKD